MSKIQRNKLVFVETVDNAEMNMALSNYRKVWFCILHQIMSLWF